MLHNLAEGLVQLLSGRQLAAGSIVLLTSATNMSLAGTAGYAEDLVATIKYLRSHLGDHLLYGVLPNMFVNGCMDPLTIRVNAEINTWAKSYFGACDTLLSNSISLAEKQIKERGGGSTQTDFRCVVRLPSSLHSPGMTSNYSSGGWDDLPASVRPPKLVEEAELVRCIIQELRGTLAVDVDPEPIMERWRPSRSSAASATWWLAAATRLASPRL
jgi:hypothetical protein